MSDSRHDQAHRRHEPVRAIASGDWLVELLPSAPYEARYTAKTSVVGFAFDTQSGVHGFGSDKRHEFRARANGLAFLPEGCDVYSMSLCGGEYLRVIGSAANAKAHKSSQRFSDIVDMTATNAARELRRCLLMPESTDPLQCEGLVQMLVERATCHLDPGGASPRSANWMTPNRLRRIDEMIEARLAEKLTVAELAAALGLSTGFFTRAFKSATGRSPQDHIIDCRLARARGLLHTSDDTLAVIASACGFASHAHMTAHYRRRLNTTPSHLRSEAKVYSGYPTTCCPISGSVRHQLV